MGSKVIMGNERKWKAINEFDVSSGSGGRWYIRIVYFFQLCTWWYQCMCVSVLGLLWFYSNLLLLLLSHFSHVPTLCDPIDGSPPGSPVPEILQARTLDWVAISFSSAWKWKVKVKSLSRVRLLVTPWTAAYQVPPSMGFSRQEYWSGVPLPSPYSNLLTLNL